MLHIAFYLGAAIATLGFFHIIYWFPLRKMERNDAARLSFLISSILCFILGKKIGFRAVLKIYIPWLVLWFVLELFRLKRMERKNNEDDSI